MALGGTRRFLGVVDMIVTIAAAAAYRGGKSGRGPKRVNVTDTDGVGERLGGFQAIKRAVGEVAPSIGRRRCISVAKSADSLSALSSRMYVQDRLCRSAHVPCDVRTRRTAAMFPDPIGSGFESVNGREVIEIRALLAELARQGGSTVREALGSYKRTVCLCAMLIAAGTAAGIYAHLKGG